MAPIIGGVFSAASAPSNAVTEVTTRTQTGAAGDWGYWLTTGAPLRYHEMMGWVPPEVFNAVEGEDVSEVFVIEGTEDGAALTSNGYSVVTSGGGVITSDGTHTTFSTAGGVNADTAYLNESLTAGGQYFFSGYMRADAYSGADFLAGLILYDGADRFNFGPTRDETSHAVMISDLTALIGRSLTTAEGYGQDVHIQMLHKSDASVSGASDAGVRLWLNFAPTGDYIANDGEMTATGSSEIRLGDATSGAKFNLSVRDAGMWEWVPA